MAISYVSRVVNPLPYIAPIDQSLVQKGLLFSQQNFDRNVNLVNQNLQAQAQQDIIHPELKQYRDQKLTELTNEINRMGGADFGDRNVMAKIDGLSRTISGDETILRAINDTRKIRKSLDTMEKWKTDPKLNKFYAPQNEWYLNKQVNDYLGTQGLEASYKGGSAQPFFDYQTDMKKMLDGKVKQILATAQQTTSGDGYMVDGKELSYHDIENMVKGQIASDPRFEQQIRIDALYNGQSLQQQPEVFRQKLVQDYTSSVTGLKAQQKQLSDDFNARIALTGDKSQKQALTRLRDQQIQALDQQIGFQQQKINQASDGTYPLDHLIEQHYIDRYAQSMGDQYHFRSQKITPDGAFAAAQRLTFEKTKFQDSQYRWQKEFDYNSKKDQQEFEQKERQLDIQASKATGLKKNSDGTFSIAPTNLIPVDAVNADGSVQNHTLDSMTAEQNSLIASQDETLKSLLTEYVAASGQIELATQMEKNFQLDKYSSDRQSVRGYKLKGNKFSPETTRALTTIVNGYNHYVNTGEASPEVDTLLKNSRTRELWNKLEQNSSIIQLYRDRVQEANRQALLASGLTPTELARMTQLENGIRNGSIPMEIQGSPNSFMGGSSTPINTPQYQEYRQYKDRLAKAHEVIAQQFGKEGFIRKNLLVSGDDLKDQYSSLNTILKDAVRKKAIAPEGRDNGDFRNLTAIGNSPFEIASASIDPFSHQVVVTLQQGSGEKAVQTGPITLEFGNRTEWLSILPPGLQQLAADTPVLEMKAHLNQTGNLQFGKKWLEFRPTSGPAVSFTTRLADGRPELLYRYNGELKRLPEAAQALVPSEFYQDPVGFLQSSQLTTWMKSQVQPALMTRYGIDPASGKVRKDFMPNVTHFHDFLQQL